jgi:hypothetical protein
MRGIRELQQKTKKKLDKEQYQRAMHKALEEGKEKSRELCPVKTGYMRSQIHYKRVSTWIYRFTCDCKYASFNEWGWYGIPEIGTAKNPIHYIGGYRPFMRPGILLTTERMKKYIKQIMIEGKFY